MMKRIVTAATAGLMLLVVFPTLAEAGCYPPPCAAPERVDRQVQVVRSQVVRVVVVQPGLPAVVRQGVLSRTGSSSMIPLAAVATGLAALGLTLVTVARRRPEETAGFPAKTG